MLLEIFAYPAVRVVHFTDWTCISKTVYRIGSVVFCKIFLLRIPRYSGEVAEKMEKTGKCKVFYFSSKRIERLQRRCFPVNLAKLLRTAFLENNSERVLLNINYTERAYQNAEFIGFICGSYGFVQVFSLLYRGAYNEKQKDFYP